MVTGKLKSWCWAVSIILLAAISCKGKYPCNKEERVEEMPAPIVDDPEKVDSLKKILDEKKKEQRR